MRLVQERRGGPTRPPVQAASPEVLGNSPDLGVCFTPGRWGGSRVERQRSGIFLQLPNNTAPGNRKLIRPGGLNRRGLCDFPPSASHINKRGCLAL